MEETLPNPTIRLAGDWTAGVPADAATWFFQNRGQLVGREISVDVGAVAAWNGRLVAFLLRLRNLLRRDDGDLSWHGLPTGLAALLRMAENGQETSPMAVMGRAAEKVSKKNGGNSSEAGFCAFAFLGDLVRCLCRFFFGKVPTVGAGYGEIFYRVGVEGLPIVALISLLSGVIIGFVGIVQLARFGAAIYIADLVGLAMVREMAPLMTGIILAGRTAASFAATIGTMRCSGEVDALRIFSINPVAFLVLPRVLAVAWMAPILEIFSAFIGIGGGMVVALSLFDFSAVQYVQEMVSAVAMSDFFVGIGKALVFGLLTGGFGCLHGMRCERTAAGVGRGTTAAVVSAITAIVVADAIFSVLCHRLHM
ncbi:MAG: ABC transporter permease [Puniceicoccales bacterium]|nr:ABC transporter permease [Puniceicoccales bacterium]